MHQLTNKEYEKYEHYLNDELHGRLMTPEGLKLMCAAFDNDPEAIGKHLLSTLQRFESEQ